MDLSAPTSHNIARFLLAFNERRLALLQDDFGPLDRSVLVAAAQNMTKSLMNELLTLSAGVVFVALSPARTQAFMLNPMSRLRMTASNTKAAAEDYHIPLLCESVEAREGVTTGISAADRALTTAILGEEQPAPRKLVRPGHIFPIEVCDGGVLMRNALPEGALDIVKLTGHTEAAVFADILDEQGDFMNACRCRTLCTRHQIPMISLSSLTLMRLQSEALVYKVAEAKLPTRLAGELRSCIYKCKIHDGEHLALIKGQIDPELPVLTRVQPEFTFSDVFGGSTPPSRLVLERCLKAIGERGQGVFIYLRRPAAGQLREQIESWQTAYRQKPALLMREYGLGAQILRHLGVRKVELLSAGRLSLVGLKTFGMEIISQRPIPP